MQATNDDILAELQTQTAILTSQQASLDNMLALVVEMALPIAVCAIGVGYLVGMYTWRLIILAKNQRKFW